MKKTISILFLLLLSQTNIQLYGCTVFMCTNGERTLVGANEDYKKKNSKVWFIPAQNGRFGYAMFGYDGDAQAGINEKGLFWDGLRAFPSIKVSNESNRYDIGYNIVYKIIEECASVDDVIKLFKNYYWEGFGVAQFMFADKTGESAIIAWYNNELTVTRNTRNYQVCTNFRISCKEDAKNFRWYNIGSKRFKKAEKLINKQELTVENCFSILDATHQNNVFAKTIYSTVSDLNSGDIYISVNGDFSQIIKINIHEELKRKKHSYFLSDIIKSTKKNRKSIELHDDKYLTKENEKIFFDKEWNITTRISKTKYYRIIEKDSISNHYIMKDYFVNDTLQGITYCSSIDLEIRDGKYFEYHENGKIKVSGHFKHRLKDGEWKYWLKDEILEKTIKYSNGIRK